MKKFLSFVLCCVMLTSLCIPAFAAETTLTDKRMYEAEPKSAKELEMQLSHIQLPDLQINDATLSKSTEAVVRQNKEVIIESAEMFENMSLAELNEYINDKIAKLEDTSDVQSMPTRVVGVGNAAVTKLELKLLWLAAAQAAKLAGYPCSAKLVEHSALGISYDETKGSGGLFHDKIVTTNVYKNFIKELKKGTKKVGEDYVLTHTKSENSDLYYSLHDCTYTGKKSGKTYKISIYDKYDFDLMNYDSIFTGVVNNWAWLCQNAGVLNVIHVNISFTA